LKTILSQTASSQKINNEEVDLFEEKPLVGENRVMDVRAH